MQEAPAADEALARVLSIDDVQRVKQRLHGSIGAPKRDEKSDRKREPERLRAL